MKKKKAKKGRRGEEIRLSSLALSKDKRKNSSLFRDGMLGCRKENEALPTSARFARSIPKRSPPPVMLCLPPSSYPPLPSLSIFLPLSRCGYSIIRHIYAKAHNHVCQKRDERRKEQFFLLLGPKISSLQAGISCIFASYRSAVLLCVRHILISTVVVYARCVQTIILSAFAGLHDNAL